MLIINVANFTFVGGGGVYPSYRLSNLNWDVIT